LIDKQTIARILDTAHIEEVIGEFVKLKKSGANYKGLSPFTNERNASFFVSPAKGIFKCFSSGKGGNVVNFLMEHEHFTYPEALRYLAKKYNIAIHEEEPTPEEKEAQNEREALFLVNAFAQKFFTGQMLETEKGRAIGLEYFKERGFKTDIIEKFQLGYSPDGWDAFTRYALENGYKKEYLEKTGLTITKEDRSYDRFRGRVVFPVHNITGRVLGFGGRTLSSDDNIPKYVNSPESDIYNKSHILYGLFFAKNAIIRNDNCYLVEGYTDVISLHQAGIENVVASSGTSLTEEQIRLIKRYTPNITILYDGDPAGIKASFRGIDMVLEQGMNVRIVLFPDGEDPDSFARKRRRQELEDLITNEARDFIRFKTGLLMKEAAGDPIKRAGLIKEIVGSISLIPDQIYRTVYIRECSTILEMPEQTLMNELNKILRRRFQKRAQELAAEQDVELVEYPSEKQVEQTDVGTEFQERDVIRLLLMYGRNEIVITEESEDKKIIEHHMTVAEYITEEIIHDDIPFHNPVYQKIFDEFRQMLEKDLDPDEATFINHEDDHVVSAVIDLISSQYELSDNWERHRIYILTEKDKLRQAVEGTLLSFKSRTIRRMILDLQKEIKIVKEDEEMMKMLLRMKELKEISKMINAQLGRVVTN
jgi:DNA primase